MADGADSPRRRPSIKTASVAATFSRSASQSTGSLGGDDEQQGRSSTTSGDSSPTQQQPPRSSRRVSRRKSSAASITSPTGSPTASAATFLSRFIGNFRSSSSSLSAPRPSLARSVSNPGQPRSSSDMGPPPVPSIPGAFPSTAPQPSFPHSSSTLNRFRPSFTRRATTAGTPSPRGSPAHSPTLSSEIPRESPGSPATLRGRERDPMEMAFGGVRAGGHTQAGSMDSRADSPGLRSTRRGSTVSQATVQAEPGGRTPMGDGQYGSLRPIAEPTTPAPLKQPLDLISTLLPPALLLLSHLGPNHLFSPPLVHPLLHREEGHHHRSERSNSDESTAPVFNDRASIASSTTSSTSSTFPLLLSTNHITHAYSHELHAPSTLSIPAVSAAAVWRLFRGFEWIGEVGGGTPLPGTELNASADEFDDCATFDFPSALQGVADVLAADAGARGVELVIGQVGSGSAPSPVTTPSAEEVGQKEKDTESRELLVRGDERAWSVMLIWILHHIVASADYGATVEVRFLATAIPSPTIPVYTSASADSDEQPPPTDKRWAVSLEILHTFAATTSSPFTSTPASDHPLPPFATSFAKSFFAQLNLDVTAAAEHDDSRSWVLSTELTSCRPKAVSDDPSSLLGRRRATLESSAGQEPTMNDLKRFAEVALKGHKVALHAGEQSAFAKHLTAYLAGWGMDVSHVPLDSDETQGGQVPESLWNKGRREPYRVDSGFGTQGSSPLTPFDEPTMSPLASLVADNAAPPATSPTELPSDLIIIDDDIITLRRLLSNLRTAPSQYPPSMMGKRPQLATRRTRSSPHVRQVHQIPAATSTSVIIHFASLTHYKAIKDIVQSALASSRTPTLPEVLVIPKPAGPRRIITALWTAIKRPAVDPSLPPIATSPTSPGVQYWTPRLSPALAKEQEFDFVGSDTSGSNREATSSHSAKPRTPPAYFGGTTVSAANHPPSPLGKISDDQVSYFSVVADGMDGTTPSEGMVIQSPDGRPAIFFQPQTRGSRTERAREKAARVERSMSSDSKDGEEDASIPPSRAPMATPHDIGLGQARRSSGPSAVLSDPAAVIGTPALTLDSFITAAKSRAVGEEPPEPEPAPSNPAPQLTRQQSTASMISRPPSARPPGSGNTSPRVGASSPAFAARRMTGGSTSTPPMTPAPNSPHVGAQAATTTTAAPRTREPSAPGSPGFLQSRRGTMSFGKKAKKPARKTSLATVPPINVLIVEDNPINQTILSMFMKKKGIKYAVAKDGEEAVQKWKAGSFHLVLMDIQLPVKSGIEATREIREMERANNIGTFITTPTTDPSSPISLGGSSSSGQHSAMSSIVSSPVSPPLTMPVIIVALTASSLQVDRVSALAAGCNDFLTKPVSLQWLQQKLLEWGSMAYLSGFSLMRSNNTSPFASPSIARPLTQATHAGFTAGLNSKAEIISAHLHIDPRPHGRSPAASPARSPARSSSPLPAADAAPQAPSTVHAIEAQAAVNGSAAPPSPIPLASNPSLTISSPTPILTPRPPTTADLSPPAVPPPTAQDISPAAPVASPARVEPSRPADLDAVEKRLESLTAPRPGPSPLPSDASMSDLTLEGVMAEGARLVGVVDAGRSRAGSAGDSFSKVMHDSGTVSQGGSPEVLQGEGSPTP